MCRAEIHGIGRNHDNFRYIKDGTESSVWSKQGHGVTHELIEKKKKQCRLLKIAQSFKYKTNVLPPNWSKRGIRIK